MFYIVCVLYNKPIERISSITLFKEMTEEHEDVQVVIYDNSTDKKIKQKNNEYALSDRMLYINNEGNIGLSKTYNKALAITNTNDWIFWADDDTIFSLGYLNNVYSVTKKERTNVISGVIYSTDNALISPVFSDDKKTTTSFNMFEENYGMVCINSGLCIKRSVYESIGYYDESLFLDMIDYWLFDELRKKELDGVYIVAGEITQAFSGHSDTPIKTQIQRFRIYAKDFNRYCTLERRSMGYRIKILTKRFGGIILRKICRSI